MKTFRNFVSQKLIIEMGPGPGIGFPGALPGGPMGGDMGGPPGGLGGALPPMPPPGGPGMGLNPIGSGPIGSDPLNPMGGQSPPQVAPKLKALDVWSVLERILGMEEKNDKQSQSQSQSQPKPQPKPQHLMV